MTMTIEIPDAVTGDMQLSTAETQRRALIGIVVEGYRKHELSRGQVSEKLNLSFWETAELLKEHGCGIGSDMSFEEFEQQGEQLREYLAR